MQSRTLAEFVTGVSIRFVFSKNEWDRLAISFYEYMLGEYLRLLIDLAKRTLGIARPSTDEEIQQLTQLADAILEHGRMIQAYHGCSMVYVTVEIPELASRFRETPHTVEDALLLLRKKGFAEPAELPGCWKLQLADTVRRDQGDVA
jgi:hypothetical protein